MLIVTELPQSCHQIDAKEWDIKCEGADLYPRRAEKLREIIVADITPIRNAYLQNLLERFPDYQNFTASDFSKLPDGDLRTLLGVFAHKVQPESLIPQSFVRQYGDDAAGQMMLAVEREAARRGKTELYASATLHGGLGNAANVKGFFNVEVPASVTLADNTVRRSTAPKILNFQVAQDAALLMAKNEAARRQGTYTPQTDFDVVAPQSAIAAVVAANKNLPASFATKGFSFIAGDELAFMSGYATFAGASREIGSITMDHPVESFCQLDRGVSRIFNPNRPDMDAALAWAVGYIQREMDEMPAAQRTAVIAGCQKGKAAASR